MITLEEVLDKPPVYLGDREFLFEVWRVFSESPVWNLKNLERQLSKKQYGQYPYINGGIKLLRFIGIIFGDDNSLRMVNNLPGDRQLNEIIACRLINMLHRTNDFIEVFPAGSVSIDTQNHNICLVRRFMEFKYAPIWNLLRDILSIEQSNNIEKVYLISTNALLDEFSLNASEKSRLISQRDLERILKAQSLAGAKAERVALEYEKQRLRDRNDLSHVRIISDYNVNAGYDIISYDNNTSKCLDRFIEVKSFIGSRPQFYWSSNEMDMAKKYGNQYFIYLIDRLKMHNSNFELFIIQNPAKNVLGSTNWALSPDGLLCQSIGDKCLKLTP